VDGSDYWEDPDEPYGGTSVRDSSPPFGELALKKCDRWCAEDLPRRGKQPVSKSSGSCSLSAGCAAGTRPTLEVPALLRHHQWRRATGGYGDGVPALNRLALVDKRRPRTVAGSSAPACSDDTSLDDWRSVFLADRLSSNIRLVARILAGQ